MSFEAQERPAEGHDEDPRGGDQSDQLPESGPGGQQPGGDAGEARRRDDGASERAPESASDEDSDAGTATGNPDAAG